MSNAHTELRSKCQRAAREAIYRNRPTACQRYGERNLTGPTFCHALLLRGAAWPAAGSARFSLTFSVARCHRAVPELFRGAVLCRPCDSLGRPVIGPGK
jgi:hypothetical protein